MRITQKPGESFIDRMIALVEGANRQKTPNEIALNILLAALTIIFLLAVATLQPLAIFSKAQQAAAPDTLALNGDGVTGIVLVSLLVCLIPTTIGALLSAIGIAGMDRLVQRNVLAMCGRAVEAAGDVNTLLLDKTGTITLGNRQASEFLAGRRRRPRPSWPTRPSCPAWPTRRPRAAPSSSSPSSSYGLRERQPGELGHATWVAVHRADPDVRCGPDRDRTARSAQVRKGAATAVMKWVRDNGGHPSDQVGPMVDGISALRRHAAGGRRARRRPAGPGARRHPPQGRRQAGHAASGSTRCAGWASAP